MTKPWGGLVVQGFVVERQLGQICANVRDPGERDAKQKEPHWPSHIYVQCARSGARWAAEICKEGDSRTTVEQHDGS